MASQYRTNCDVQQFRIQHTSYNINFCVCKITPMHKAIKLKRSSGDRLAFLITSYRAPLVYVVQLIWQPQMERICQHYHHPAPIKARISFLSRLTGKLDEAQVFQSQSWYQRLSRYLFLSWCAAFEYSSASVRICAVLSSSSPRRSPRSSAAYNTTHPLSQIATHNTSRHLRSHYQFTTPSGYLRSVGRLFQSPAALTYHSTDASLITARLLPLLVRPPVTASWILSTTRIPSKSLLGTC